MSEMAVMDPVEGDIKVIWDKDNPDEVEAARAMFDRMVGEKRFMAYSVKGRNGEKNEIIRTFDPEAERLILSPPMVGG